MIDEKQDIIMLIDTYEELLTEKQKNILHEYYYNDFSLFEIAEGLGITKQAVKDTLGKAVNNLKKYESALHLAKKQKEFNKLVKQKDKIQLLEYANMLENLFKE